MKPAKRKIPIMQNLLRTEEKQTPPPQASCPQRFSALVAKYTLQDGAESDDDCFSGKEGVESKTHSSDYDSNSGDSDDEVYI